MNCHSTPLDVQFSRTQPTDQNRRGHSRATSSLPSDTRDIKVVVLTNSAKAPFLVQQIDRLAERGVSFDVLEVPGDPTGDGSRSPIDYAHFFDTVLQHPLADYDLLHAHYGLTAPMAITQQHVPTILSLWGSDVHGPVGLVSRLCARRCSEVVVMSERMNERMGGDCLVIPDGVDTELFRPLNRSDARSSLGWDDRSYHVLFPYPPHRTVKNYPLARSVVQATDRTLDSSVTMHVLEGIEHDEMPVYMNAADVLLLTSKREGSPNVVKESMACNLPVVSTDVGDVSERLDGVHPSIVSDSHAGLVRGLRSVLLSGQRSNGREAIDPVRLSNSVDRIYTLYRHVIDAASGQRQQ